MVGRVKLLEEGGRGGGIVLEVETGTCGVGGWKNSTQFPDKLCRKWKKGSGCDKDMMR